MNARGQRGMTLVELLVAMAITTVVLVGVTGVLFNVTSRYEKWTDRISDASQGSALAAAIQADSHRYVVCHSTDHVPNLDLCVPNTSTPAVTYTVDSSGPPYAILRTQNGKSVLMARGFHGQPVFWSECRLDSGAGTVSGHIHVYGYREIHGSAQNFSIYYHAPVPQGGCPS